MAEPTLASRAAEVRIQALQPRGSLKSRGDLSEASLRPDLSGALGLIDHCRGEILMRTALPVLQQGVPMNADGRTITGKLD